MFMLALVLIVCCYTLHRRAQTHPVKHPITYRTLTCFGGPRDMEEVVVNDRVDTLRVPFVNPAHARAHGWEPDHIPVDFGPLYSQAVYQRMWIGDKEQFVFQRSIT